MNVAAASRSEERGSVSKSHSVDVERYYDFIYHWAQITNRFRAFSIAGAYAIHRGLIEPETGEFSTDTIHRLIERRVGAGTSVRALDAGCGYGGTCIELHKRMGGSWHGITISERQVQVATRNIKALGVADSIRISQASFDAALPQAYNLVYGIESLIHAEAPDRTIANLAAALVPGGLFIIVDDMPRPGLPANLAADLRQFKALWRCPVMPSVVQWTCHLANAGCEIEGVVDLTKDMRPRSEPETLAALAEVEKKRRWRDLVGLKLVSDAQAGGLLLERLTREGAVQYAMIVARKI